MRQQIDPIAQAMQILQLINQRRGQRAEIAQGQQRVDIAQQGMEQQGRQFQQGMDWDRERALMQQKQFEDAQSLAKSESVQRGVADERKFRAEELHRKQMLEKIQQQTQAGNMQNLRAMLGDLQNEAMLSQNDPVKLQQIQHEAEQIRQRLREFYQLQPIPQAPVDPKTAKLNAQFLTQ